MSDLGVCHLVRQANGPELFVQFLNSYLKNPANIEHELFLLFKGFSDDVLPAEYANALKSVRYSALFLTDEGFDIGSYFAASQGVRCNYLCFLNSFSVIQSEGWLKKLFDAASLSRVGVVGATGSAESHTTNFLDAMNSVPSAKFSLRRLIGQQLRQSKLRELQGQFEPFPNYHLRTNAFLISRTLMLSLKRGQFQTKLETERFESSRQGLTQQLAAQGLRALVVGHDGLAYDKEQWAYSHTFRSGNQENLLIADNRTRQYEQADDAEKQVMRVRSWGEKA